MSEPPNNFPLDPLDSVGKEIKVGDTVKVLRIPDWLLSGLDEKSIQNVKACEGREMRIYEMDKYGYAWLEAVSLQTESAYESNSFCMEPKNLLKQ